MDRYLVYLILIIIVIIIILCLCLKHIFTPSCDQTLSFNLNLNNTYRYCPDLDGTEIRPVDSLKISIGGKLKSDQMIIKSNELQTILNSVKTEIENTIFVKDISILDQNLSKYTYARSKIVNQPTIENLSYWFYQKFNTKIKSLGLYVNSVEVQSGNISASRDRR